MAITRLIYGFLSQSTDPVNMAVPWETSNQDGQFRMNYSLEKAVETNLRVWAKTNWGERPMRFRFGLDAKRYLFEPESIAKEKIKSNAYEQLSLYFPFLEVDSLEVLTSSDNNGIPEHALLFTLEAHFIDDENKRVRISEEVGT